jgi:hypothetical protein
MTLLSVLYTLIISPLELLFEVIFTPAWNPSELEGTAFPASDRYVISGGKPHDPRSWTFAGNGK